MLRHVPPLRSLFWYGVLPFQTVTCSMIFLNDHVLEITDIKGSSMAPTLSPDYATTQARDSVAWKKWRPTRDLRRGDVVLFSTPHNPDGIAAKRVIALSGDTVLLDPRRRPKAELDGRFNHDALKWDMWYGRVVVPQGHVWVEGDNWRDTHDSNAYGPISKGLIRGRAMALVWPWREMGNKPWERFETRTRVQPGVDVDFRRDRNEKKIYWKPA